MDYVTLGHSGIEVSRICVGGMSFGAPDPSQRWQDEIEKRGGLR